MVSFLISELPKAPAQERGKASAPLNIAVVKYWGKRDSRLNLPLTDSLSLSLPLYTKTEVALSKAGDHYTLNGHAVDPKTPFSLRLRAYLDMFRTDSSQGYSVATVNEMPTAAGLASSSSGFAALAAALDDLYGWGLPREQLSILARLGSGSAARSVCKGFVRWYAGEREDGMDSFARRLDFEWPQLRVGLLVADGGPKAVSSRSGMLHVQETSPLYTAWPGCVARDMELIGKALASRDFGRFGEIMEGNALAMHALCDSARPAVMYLSSKSRLLLEQVRELRRRGIPVYATMDAGPNLKLFYEEESSAAVREFFPYIQELAPCF